MIRRARIRAEVDLSMFGPTRTIRAGRHPDGVVLTFRAAGTSRFLLVTPSGEAGEFAPGWEFADGFVAGVDARGRVIGGRESGDRLLRRYDKGNLDATYPIGPPHDMTVLPDGRIAAVWATHFEIFAETAIPEKNLARVVKRGPVRSLDVDGPLFAAVEDRTVLVLGTSGRVEREFEAGVPKAGFVRAGGGVLWVLDNAAGELMAVTPEGHPLATAEAPVPLVGPVAHADGSLSVVSLSEGEERLIVFE